MATALRQDVGEYSIPLQLPLPRAARLNQVGSASLPNEGGDNGNGAIYAVTVSGGAATAHRKTEATRDDCSAAKKSAFEDDRMEEVVALDLYAMD